MRYFARRAVSSLLQVLALSFISFLVFQTAPGDYFSDQRLNPDARAESVRQWRRAHDLDRPWTQRYAAWLASCGRGDFGNSTAYGLPVWRLLGPRLSGTLAIVAPAFLIGWGLGLGLALAASGSRLLPLAEPAMTVAVMVPDVLVANLVMWTALTLGHSVTGAWLPVTAIASGITATVFLHAAGSLAAARRARFVQLAERRGVSGRALWLEYIFPAAANPLISLIPVTIVAAVGSSLAVEAMTGWTGLGLLFLDAFHSRDFPVVQGVILLLGISLSLFQIMSDLLLYRLDPRIRPHI
jgi:peptide/nickel transport system permease protein